MASVSDPSSRLAQSSTSASPPTSHEAAYAVLNTNELLCEIIGRLPLHDIVITTGVCRAWRNALKASVAIQQAMFLAPADVREITTTTKCLSLHVKDIPRGHHAIVAELNPYTTRICGQMHGFTDPPWTSDYGHGNAPPQRFEHPHGTWRNMFVTQPSVETLQVSFYTHCQLYSVSAVSFSCDEGITLGKLHAFIESIAYQRPYVVTSLTPQGLFPSRSLSVEGGYNRWWEVRKGKVHRRIEPPNNLIDVTGDVSNADDDGPQMPV
jgi:hypothetical protein